MADQPITKGERVVEFSPSRRYIKENLAPERIRTDLIIEGAKSTRKAVDKGILPVDTASLILSNILVENRHDYGANTGEYYAKNPGVKKVIEALDLQGSVRTQKVVDDDTALRKLYNNPRDPRFPLRSDMLVVESLPETAEYAKWMTAVMAIKSLGSKSPLETIKKWNGAGPEADNHVRKVIETSEMLKHPANAEILKLFQDTYNEAGVK